MIFRSGIVVILAPRDEAATFLDHFFSQTTACTAAPASEVRLWKAGRDFDCLVVVCARHPSEFISRSENEYIQRDDYFVESCSGVKPRPNSVRSRIKITCGGS